MLIVKLSNPKQNLTHTHPGGPLEIGRGPQRDVPRLVVEDRYTSRDQLRIEPLSDGRLLIENLGSIASIANMGALATGEKREVSPPIRVTFGYTTIEVRWEKEAQLPGDLPADDGSALHTINTPIRPRAVVEEETHQPLDLGQAPTPAMLTMWFERLLAVQRAAAGSDEFYEETARAIVDLIGLDSGMVLLRSGEQWRQVACHPPHLPEARRFSRRILAEVVKQGRTFYQAFEGDAWGGSLVDVEAVVASPIFDAHDQVVGVVYGRRDLRTGQRGRGIQPLEAQLVQVLAAAVSSGLVRKQSEEEAARTRVQFEQFFSPELARALRRNPSLLEGQEREVTVMFGDLRGFSGISEIIGARQTYRLLSDIMDRFTHRIMEEDGVVIDYYGDGFAAMWNAPAEQPDHVMRACRAAWKILAELPPLNAQWEPQLGKPVRIGVGINTGVAQVGNAGSSRRLKYGPRGHTVNLASRIEGATKLLGVPCLVSEYAVAQLPAEVPRRLICRARVTGIAEPVALYELAVPQPDSTWWELKERYEKAWEAFEKGEFAECLRGCAELASGAGKEDVPTRLLAQRASAQLAAPDPHFEPVYSLDTKGG
ncbi:MAG: hypothetical protein KatS3mg110_4518 [Pirellulaceae bacterium]|nr:MAG: hypothetical protein KatS3mg110_4518 [Pirellulaceae bacterium]